MTPIRVLIVYDHTLFREGLQAIFLTVLAAVLICAVVVLLFAAGLTDAHFGTAIALLFIASMIAIGAGFAVFLVETRVGSRAVRIRSELLAHEAEADDS